MRKNSSERQGSEDRVFTLLGQLEHAIDRLIEQVRRKKERGIDNEVSAEATR